MVDNYIQIERQCLIALRKTDQAVYLHTLQVTKVVNTMLPAFNLDGAGRFFVTAAILHDIGKVVEPSNHSDHPHIGAELFQKFGLTGNPSTIVADGIRFHHERYNGAGSPSRLQGEAIPLVARIIEVADAFSLLTTGSSYRKAMGSGDACNVLVRKSGIDFDPHVVDVFCASNLL